MVRQKSALLGFALSLAILGMTACEDTTVDIPEPEPPPLEISVTPAAQTIEIGGTAQVVAQVTGGATGGDKSVTWTSSNTAVATVSANGNVATVTGEAAGNATIIARAVADANVTGAASITVSPGAAPPTISIKSITAIATNLPVDRQNVRGQIEITLNLDVPAGAEVERVEILADNEVIYTQGFSGLAFDITGGDEAQSAVELIASWNTARFSASGIGTQATVEGDFDNGSTTITAQVVGPQGTITANTNTDIVLNNTPFVYARLVAPATNAINPGSGLLWYTGDIVVQAMGVKFSSAASADLASITLTNSGSDPASTTDDTPSDGFSLTLQKSGNPSASRIELLESAGVVLTLNSVTAGGTTGPACIVGEATPTPINVGCVLLPTPGGFPANQLPMASPLNWDNVGPAVAGTITLLNPANPWISTAQPVSTMDNGLTITDGGVSNPVTTSNTTRTLQYRTNGSTGSYTSAPNGPADVPESLTNNAYQIRLNVCDALNNCTGSATAVVGSDQTLPVLVAAMANAAANTAVPAGAMLNYTVTDVPSGPDVTPGLASLVRRAPNTNQCQIGTAATGGGCSAPADVGGGGAFTITLPGPDGYTDLTVQAQDNSGLVSATVNVVHLIDATPPSVGNIALPPVLTGGQPATFTSVGTDNIDVATSQARLMFNTVALQLPFGPPTAQGTFGFDTYTTTANLSETIPFIQSLYAAGSDPSVTANGDNADAVQFRVTDFGGNASSNSQPFGQVITPGPVANLTAGQGATFVVATPSAATTVCNQDAGVECPGSPDSPTTTVTATIQGPSGAFVNPFTTVYFFRVDAGGVSHLIASAGMVLTSDTGNPADALGRTYTATITFDGTGMPVQANVPIYAIGVDASGDGLLTPQNTNVSVASGS